MNWFVLIMIPFLLGAAVIGVLAPMIGLIVAIAGMLVSACLFWLLTRGLPMEFIKAKFGGGILLLIGKKSMDMIAGRVTPKQGVVETKEHGTYRIIPERLYRCAGVPVALAPEDLAFNVGLDHAELVHELKKSGVKSITQVSELDKSGRISNINDPGVAVPGHGKTGKEIVTLSDFARYSVYAANPLYTDAQAKLKVATALYRGAKSEVWKTLLILGFVVFLIIVGITLLRGQEVTVKVALENMEKAVIPA